MRCKFLLKTLIFFLFCFFSSVSGRVVHEKTVLLELKSSVSDPHGILSTWNSNEDNSTSHCSWFGVSCNSNSRVVSIKISGGEGFGGNYNSQAFSCSKSLEFPFHAFGVKRSCASYLGKLKGKLSPLIGKLSELRVLSLPYNELGGDIPKEIWGLQKLEVVDLEGNLFTGKLPNGLVFGLKKLRVLNLGFNTLDGEIPVGIVKFEALEVLNLAGNRLKGSIPMVFGGFSKLRGVYLGNNELNGTVPDVFGSNCRYLEHLDLSRNFLVGGIPASLGKCGQLRTLLLFSNVLSGVIPTELGQLRRLQVLDVSRNSISGLIPAELGNCVELSVLVLSSLFETWQGAGDRYGRASLGLPIVANDEYNRFQGSIPINITILPKLRVLWAARASLRGKLPIHWGSCHSLEMVNLAQNSFSGEINGVFQRCKKLYYLDLSSNRLTGELDDELPVPCMTVFNVDQNLMSGPIPRFKDSVCPRVPSSVLHLSQVEDPVFGYSSFFMHRTRVASKLPFSVNSSAVIHNFSGNDFTGPIPELPVATEQFEKQIDYAFLAAGNKLTGLFPESLFGKCGDLYGMIANVSNNQIFGEIPLTIGAMCNSLRLLDASGNLISGSLPQSLGDLKSLVSLDFSGNKLQGQIPASLHQLKYLRHMGLASNNLTGMIPSSIGDLHSLEVLKLSSNSFSGEIPQDIVNLKSLTALLLDNNNLSGQIPYGLANMASLSAVNLCFNTLSGFSSMNGKLASCSSSFLGNPRHRVLLSPSSPNPADSNSGQEHNATSGNNIGRDGFNAIEIASIASASAIVSVLISLVALFFYTRYWMPNGRVQVSEPKAITVFVDIGVPLLYENIALATGYFNASYCIGNGGFGATYKAEIAPGTVVAVKRLAVGRLQGVEQFRAEIKALGRVRHTNLVTLIGYHASEAEMFLIYNYFPGGNLENFIKERSSRAVNWKILHKIALDIARALAYLHESSPRILHRDVKPSNILLDGDFNAFLSDFGLSRLLGSSETHATTGVAGTFGYVAPEYAMTCRVSEKADVYSYGVVLLELISDKKALDPSFSTHENGFNIVSWACMLLRHGRAKEVFTAGLWDLGPHDDLVEVLHLAVRSTVDSLSSRPTMKQVAQQLKRMQPP